MEAVRKGVDEQLLTRLREENIFCCPSTENRYAHFFLFCPLTAIQRASDMDQDVPIQPVCNDRSPGRSQVRLSLLPERFSVDSDLATQRSSFPSYAMYSKMVLGETLSSALAMTRGKILMGDCE